MTSRTHTPEDVKKIMEPWRDSASDYERGFIDGMQKQMQSSVDKAVNAIKEALAQPEQHQDWCASLTQMLMSMPPKPAPCNCKPKPEPLPWIDKMVIDVPNQILYTAPQRKEPEQEPVVWMYQDKSTHEVRFQKHMRDFVDHSKTSEVPLYSEPLANHELQCVCGAVWCGDEMVHLPNKIPPQRKPLTDEEIILIVAECAASHQHTDIHFARAIEAAHGITGEQK